MEEGSGWAHEVVHGDRSIVYLFAFIIAVALMFLIHVSKYCCLAIFRMELIMLTYRSALSIVQIIPIVVV